jgi:hypothetical protein
MTIEIIIFAMTIALFLAVWRMESKWRIVITPFIILMYYEFVRILPAFVFGQTSFVDIASSSYPLVVATLAFLFLVFGFIYGYFHKPTSSSRVLALTRGGGSKLKFERAEAKGVLFLAVLLILLGLYFYDGLPVTVYSLKSLIVGEGNEEQAMMVRNLRFELTKAHYFGGEYRGQGFIRTVQSLGWALVCCYTLVVSMERQTIRATMVFLFSLCIAWVFIAGTGARGPFLNLLIVLSIVYSIRRPLRLRGMLFLVFAITTTGILLSLYSTKGYLLLVGGESHFVKNLTVMILERIFFGNAVSDIHVIELVESGALELRLGAVHWRDAVSSIPGVRYGMPLAYELSYYINPRGASTTFATGTYLSKVYADFGAWGVPPMYFLLGWLVGLVQRWVFRPRHSAWPIAISALVVFISGSVVRIGIIGVVSNLVVFAAIVFLYYLVVKLIRGGSNYIRGRFIFNNH